jgi:hypothetical protein
MTGAFVARFWPAATSAWAETYIAGRWFSHDIPALIAIAIHNRDSLAKVMRGSMFSLLTYQIKHKLRRNSRTSRGLCSGH